MDHLFELVGITVLTDYDGFVELVNENGIRIGTINPSDVSEDGWNPTWIDKKKEIFASCGTINRFVEALKGMLGG